jgi:hypothetical protein
MPVMPGRAGLAPSYRLPNPPSFASACGPSEGNDVPPVTGNGFLGRYRGGPHPGSQPMGDPQLGSNDGYWGSNNPPNMAGPPPVVFLPGEYPAGMDSGTMNNPDPLRFGIQGFNDKLRIVDRHAFWDTGRQIEGATTSPPGTSAPNTYNDPMVNGPRADLRTVNRSLTYQKGSDASRNQDDLSRGYTWLGEQGSGWAPVYGGVPGLYEPYGTRGGYPYPIVSPAEYGSTGDGRQVVFSGPPHGLHSLTYPNNGDTLDRYKVNPQMRPVRFDRPSNSPQAGQSYNQTVLPQGAVPAAKSKPQAWTAKVGGRGWIGTPG